MKSITGRAATRSHRPGKLFVSQVRAFEAALRKQRYAKSTIRDYLREYRLLGSWLRKNGLELHEINDAAIDGYLRDTSGASRPHTIWGRRRATTAIHALLRHLQDAGVIAPSAAESSISTEADQWLNSYRMHLERVKGLAPSTCQQYCFFVSRLVKALSCAGVIDWSAVTADNFVEFVQSEAAGRRGSGPSNVATVVRSFLRFLISQGRLPAKLMNRIPTVRRWPQAALPQRLSQEEIKQLIEACIDGTAIGQRNYAVVLLLSCLGLRAKEVARLQLGDIDWVNGCIVIRAGKTHRERVLPLPQSVGEALLSYLQNGRPATSHRDIFLEHRAPFRPLKTASAITLLIKRLLAKANIKRKPSGAHLLRHALATEMVNHGASFKEVADVLGHQALETTAIYAKLNLAALSGIALPWPGGVQ